MGRRRRSLAGRQQQPPRQGAPAVAGHEIVGPVGFGANGPVWSARDGAGRDVVVSVLPLPKGAAGTAQLRRLAALRHGNHPHLARIRQVVSVDSHRCAVVSDRVEGATLATVCAARGPLTDGELATVLAGIGNALGHLHERGVVHGDVSPANVIITGDGVPVLVDLAGQVAHETGTAGFVAPERRRGSAAGAPGDVWALARLVAWAGGERAGGERTGGEWTGGEWTGSDRTGGARAAARALQLLGPALDTDPDARPDARDLASRAAALAGPVPVAVPPASALAQARMRVDEAPTRRRAVSRRAAVRPPTGGPVPREPVPRERAREGRAPVPTSPRSGGAVRSREGGVRTGRATTKGASESSRMKSTSTKGPTTKGAPGARRPEGTPTQTPDRAGQRRHARQRAGPPAWVGAGVTMATAAVLAGVVVLSAPGERLATYGHTVARGDPAPTAVVDVVAELLTQRDHALVAQDSTQLATTTVAGGAAAREDAALLESLVSSGTVLEDLRTHVEAVRGVEEVEDGTAVDVVLVQEPHERLVSGRRMTVPAQPARCTRLVVRSGGDGAWQILRSEPCP